MPNDNVNNYKVIYDNIYNNIPSYNFSCPIKDLYIDKFAELIGIGKTFVDLGCGEGNNLKRLIKFGYKFEGVEISTSCCTKFLTDLPHYNSDIISFSKLNKKYDAAICTDVLEHIPYSDIDANLNQISSITASILFGIANHSDILNGIELHLIQEDSSWWEVELKKYFKHVILINEMQYFQTKNIFFLFYCTNNDKIEFDISQNFEKINNLSLRSDLNHANKNVDDLQKNVDDLQKNVDDLQKNVDDLQKNVDDLQKNVDDKHRELEIINNRKIMKVMRLMSRIYNHIFNKIKKLKRI